MMTRRGFLLGTTCALAAALSAAEAMFGGFAGGSMAEGGILSDLPPYSYRLFGEVPNESTVARTIADALARRWDNAGVSADRVVTINVDSNAADRNPFRKTK